MRLIDVDEFGFSIPINESEDFVHGCEYAIKKLQKTPTTYDVDNVVKKLEGDEQHTFDGCINKRYAIEIVKSGLNVGDGKLKGSERKWVI